MAAPISFGGDFDGPMLRALVLAEKAGSVTRRLLSLVTIYDGGSRADAALLGGVGLQTVRDWVLRFNLRGPDGLVDGKSTGHPSKLNAEQRRALVAMVEAGPTPAIHGVVRWRLIDLAQWVFDEYRISVTKQILSRELRALNYRKLSARPRHHEHDEAAVAAFKKIPGPPGDDRRNQRQATRALVPRRSPHRSEKQGHATLGGTRHATIRLEGSANRLSLYLRRHLSRARQGGRSRPPILQHRGHDASPPGDRRRRRARRSRRSVCGSGRMACHREDGRARKHYPRPPPVQVTRAQSRREHLAIHAR